MPQHCVWAALRLSVASEGKARKAAISLRIFGKSQCEIVVDIFIPLIKNIVLPYVKNNVTRMGNRKKKIHLQTGLTCHGQMWRFKRCVFRRDSDSTRRFSPTLVKPAYLWISSQLSALCDKAPWYSLALPFFLLIVKQTPLFLTKEKKHMVKLT